MYGGIDWIAIFFGDDDEVYMKWNSKDWFIASVIVVFFTINSLILFLK